MNELCEYQNARCSDKKKASIFVLFFYNLVEIELTFVRVNGKSLLFTLPAFRKHRTSVRRI